MKIKCSHDLYDGDVVADKWYDVIRIEGVLYNFIDESGFKINANPNGWCAHLDDFPGAFWTVQE